MYIPVIRTIVITHGGTVSPNAGWRLDQIQQINPCLGEGD
jgi:hypothetical protein